MKQVYATLLAMVNLLSAITLLALSAWFIAACAIAGHVGVLAGFNYVVPAAVIRLLAIIRLASGYFEKYIGHLALLDTLAKIRYQLLNRAFRSETIKQSYVGFTLQQETEQFAARWSAIYSPLLASGSATLGLSLMMAVLLPELIGLWFIYLGTVVGLLACYCWLSKRAEHHRTHSLQAYLFAQRQWLHTSALWALHSQQQSIETLTDYALTSAEASQRQADLLIRFDILLMTFSLLWVMVFAHQVTAAGNQSALYAIPFIILFATRDWLLPAYAAASQPVGGHWKQATQTPQTSINESPLINQPTTKIHLLNFKWQRAHQHGLPITAQLSGPGIVLLAAPSGVGKSSALLAMVKELPYSGNAILNGTDISKLSASFCRRHIHYAEQFAHIFSGTVRENLNVVAKKTEQDLIAALQWAELSDWATAESLNQWIGEAGRPISGGEQKRLILARAKLSDAPILLLDEPFEALDQPLIQTLTNRLNALASNKLIIIASHIQPNSLIVNQTISFGE